MRWNTSHHRSADRACRLRAALAYSGTDSFTYAAGDSRGGSATATVTGVVGQ
ncbi:Ig-like domain-containing protein [Streptomyces sp. NPDC002671]